jgi:hypothetical protein
MRTIGVIAGRTHCSWSGRETIKSSASCSFFPHEVGHTDALVELPAEDIVERMGQLVTSHSRKQRSRSRGCRVPGSDSRGNHRRLA